MNAPTVIASTTFRVVAAAIVAFGALTAGAMTASSAEGAHDQIEIYSDTTKFENWSWASNNLSSRRKVHEGLTSMSVNYGPWQGLYLAGHRSYPLPDNAVLRFWVHGGGGHEWPIQVVLVDENLEPGPSVSFTPKRGEWELVEIPAAELGALESFNGVWWMNGTNRPRPTIYFDEVRIVLGNGEPEPEPEHEPEPEPGNAFSEDFVDDGSFERFDHGIFHRDDFVVEATSWLGDHASTGSDPGDPCGLPDPNPGTANPQQLDYKRVIERGDRADGFNSDWIYRCSPMGDRSKAHLMTSIGDTSGYSIGAFAPKPVFTDLREVRWDMNITNIGYRQFPEIKVIPVDTFDFQNLPCAIDFPCDTTTHAGLGSVGTSFFNGEMLIDSGTATSQQAKPRTGKWDESDPARQSIRARRTHFFRDNGNGTLTFGIEQEDGSYRELTGQGSFPAGAVRVVFADHNYTPTKAVREGQVAGPITFTWHWDNITIITG